MEKQQTSTLWGGRFSESTDAFVQRFTASVDFDRRLAHARHPRLPGPRRDARSAPGC